jgi:nitrite reductase/ring-hydroxylating ferredoxin subunit
MRKVSSESSRRDGKEVWRVGKVDEFTELIPKFIEANGAKIGVYLFKGRYFAYRNSCPHQGGPSVEGEVTGNVEMEIMPNGRRRIHASGERMNLVCPWHGIEYDLEGGGCRSDPRMRLKSYKVLIQNDTIMVEA